MSIDKAEWHIDSIASDLPEDAGATHIGMFVTWTILTGHISQLHEQQVSEATNAVRARAMTGREFFLTHCDAKLTERDLSPAGLAFATWYYSKHYFTDYERALCAQLPSMYHVADTWENYDKIAPVLDERFDKWRRRAKRRWWQFWKR